ncbi:MAG: SRPBCC family protein [Saprospiraceae bacterium]|nr:SRPBCC family protein [Saprospiraceae bacterium]
MKFKCSVIINKPLDEVVALFKDPDNLKHWQDGFQSYEPLSGAPGEPGSKSAFVYQQGKNRIELEETIEVNDLPDEFTADYVHTHMSNKMTNHFESLPGGQTLYEAYIDYYKLNGWMIKLMVKLFPGMFKKQTQKWLDQFKKFAESA